MEYSFVAVAFVVVVITACAQWAVALLELRKHSATREENMKKNMRKRVRAHLCYFNYFICAELQRKGEKKGKQRGACETTIFPSLTSRLQFACANSKTHDCHTKLKCSFPFLSCPLPLHPLSLFALLFYLAWFYFILFSLYFISFYCLRVVQTNSALGLLMLQLIHFCFCFCFRFHF